MNDGRLYLAGGTEAPRQSARMYSGGTGSGDGMDPWQTSVEKRLDSLDRRMISIETDVSQIKVDVGTLKTDMSHRPTHLWMAGATGTAIAAILGGVALIQKLLT